jgi:PAS domain S-box-containing protein
MKKKPSSTLDAVELRYRAEEKLDENRNRAEIAAMLDADTQRLLHELEVHQIELEMQNEQMLQQQKEMEATLSQYADLFAFAPMGYFVLTHDGTIRSANITGTKLLGENLSDLIKRRFAVFIAPDSRPLFSAFLEKVFTSAKRESCEIALQKNGAAPLWARIDAIANDDLETCRVAVLDLSERKQAEDELRMNEELYRSMFENMPGGIAYCEMLFDIDDKPRDFIYRVVNNAFESLTGLKNVVGRKATEFIPSIHNSDPQLLEMYGRVTKTGKAERFETFVASLQKSFWISVYRPKSGYFVTIFEDTTAPKRVGTGKAETD